MNGASLVILRAACHDYSLRHVGTDGKGILVLIYPGRITTTVVKWIPDGAEVILVVPPVTMAPVIRHGRQEKLLWNHKMRGM